MKRHLLKTLVIALICVAWSTHCLAWSANEPGTCKKEYGDGVNYSIKFNFKIIEVVDNVPTALITSLTFERLTENGWQSYESSGITLTYPNEIEDPRDENKIIKIVAIDHDQTIDGSWYDETSNPKGKYLGLIKKIVVSEGISIIYKLPKLYTAGLIDIELPASLTTITDPRTSIFTNLNWNYHLGTITIAAGNQKYKYDKDKYTFFECEDGVEKILKYIHTEKLEDNYTLDLPEGITQVEYMPSNTKVTKIVLPSTIDNISFANFCTKLTEFGLTTDNTAYYLEDGVLCKYGQKDGQAYNELVCYPKGKAINSSSNYTIPASVSVINSNAFYEVTVSGTPTIFIPLTVKEIKDHAFYSLGYMRLDFKNRTNEEIIIEDGAFYNSRISSYNNTKDFNDTNKSNCFVMKDEANRLLIVKEQKKDAEGNLVYDSDNNPVYIFAAKIFRRGTEGLATCYVPAGVSRISAYAFYNCRIPANPAGTGTVYIGPDVEEVGCSAFEECNIT